ncbi:dUTP diphosphatase [Ferrimicrobium sp.]|uniref:dUTP diphosphatase n=1 Tax=Ferrimicrobium sp. TaxID=2926050 RepID=UPI002635E13E|nr:dUTP diphosphatase [Ferrimicrobium sp.]
MTEIAVQVLHPEAQIPASQLPGDAGADLALVESLTLRPGARGLGRTGLAVELPSGTMGLVMPRSGLALRLGVTVLNAPGLIDAGYRGEIRVLLINFGESTVELLPGDRVAQLVVVPYVGVDYLVRDALSETERGVGGFGHTGHH